MSQAHIEQFYGIASKDQALVAKMLANTKNPDDFVANAVKEGGAMGYTFTAAEASAWIEQQKKIKASGELSDSQLESVAGGKTAKNTFTNVGNWTIGAGNSIANYFSDW